MDEEGELLHAFATAGNCLRYEKDFNSCLSTCWVPWIKDLRIPFNPSKWKHE